VLVDGIAHALIVAVEDAHQDRRLQPLAQLREAHEIHEQRRRNLVLGCRHCSVARPIGNELLHDPCRR